ncbi:uncharacterized protein K489DRAFT_354218 [Dissoconium aciculare CBS 342.82]|uniref:gamma-glutamylcyclotransferase n=1 Tax=Dissoconium aciculare CBS 342.82 TaxID=1314786 RepID=A0A6J3M8Y5_9PEZI|nr:uncharacterized protein K489DRAFT_354218 [Dissoconium aciculare CBS 342.82]KAF1824338.1 hypothetical protein K489DRAFT_354218 [Dissoconium aciculare CBS 342.82]
MNDASAAPIRSTTSAYQIQDAIPSIGDNEPSPSVNVSDLAPVPQPSPTRLEASLYDTPCDVEGVLQFPYTQKGTVLYLAYGSNLCNETFRGKRKVVPISEINVQVPTLRLTFDLPGLPYLEPCFANSALRDPSNDPSRDYRKNAWRKGLIGVVYEVTAADYANIIATEGGGASYKDILVDCYPFADDDPHASVPSSPSTAPFKAHTLFAPARQPESPASSDEGTGGRFQRPDTSYAQPSARYLKLISSGATERGLPFEYREYLDSIRPYRITTTRQTIGKALFAGFWGPVILGMFALSKLVAGKNGRAPPWMARLLTAVFGFVWVAYDRFYRPVFGDGERTIGDARDDMGLSDVRRGSDVVEVESRGGNYDPEKMRDDGPTM